VLKSLVRLPGLLPTTVDMNLRLDATKAPVGIPSLLGSTPASRQWVEVARRDAVEEGDAKTAVVMP